jgi:hypothetical protein
MFKVVWIEVDKCITEKTVFTSGILADCWSFILLNHRKFSRELFVQNRSGEFVDPPANIKALKSNVLLAS